MEGGRRVLDMVAFDAHRRGQGVSADNNSFLYPKKKKIPLTRSVRAVDTCY
jgi:hypothetical protein